MTGKKMRQPVEIDPPPAEVHRNDVNCIDLLHCQLVVFLTYKVNCCSSVEVVCVLMRTLSRIRRNRIKLIKGVLMNEV